MADKRYKLPASQRKFGGHVYQYLAIGDKKTVDADEKRLRAKGYFVHITPYRGAYAVYYRAIR